MADEIVDAVRRDETESLRIITGAIYVLDWLADETPIKELEKQLLPRSQTKKSVGFDSVMRPDSSQTEQEDTDG